MVTPTATAPGRARGPARAVAAWLMLACAPLPGRAEEAWGSQRHVVAGAGIEAPVPPGFCVLDPRDPAGLARIRDLTGHPGPLPPGNETLFAAPCTGGATAYLALVPLGSLGDGAESAAIRSRHLDGLARSLRPGEASPLGLGIVLEGRDAFGIYMRVTTQPSRGAPECAAMARTVASGVDMLAMVVRRCEADAIRPEDMALLRAVTERLVRATDEGGSR